MNPVGVSGKHATVHILPSALIYCLRFSLYLPDWLLGQSPACDLMQLCRAYCSTGFQASLVLLATAGRGTEFNAVRHIQLQSPQPIVSCSLLYLTAEQGVLHR